MDDKTQIIMTSSDLPDPQNAGQAYQQHGDNNIMVPNYGTVHISLQQASFTVPPQMGVYQPTIMPMPQIYTPPQIDREYFNLFVVLGEELEKGYFKVPRDRVLSESMTEETKEMFATLTGEMIERVKTLPSLFMLESNNYGYPDDDQMVIYGFVTGIKMYEESIKIYFCGHKSDIPQNKINDLREELWIKGSDKFNELNRTHWAIKKVDLIAELYEAGIQVPIFQSYNG